MKKSLFALAAATAFTGAAQAQSSVTVYGILDVGYIGTNTRNVYGNNIKTNSNGIGSSAETSSRLGFRGTEDMGGGNTAFFTAEFQLYPTSSTLSADNNNGCGSNVSGLSNRQTFVGIAKKGLGQISLGTQYTPIHEAVGATDPGQQNNTVGSAIYPVKVNGSDLTTSAYTVRNNNTIMIKTERMSGVMAKLYTTIGMSDATQSTAGTAPSVNTQGFSTNNGVYNNTGIGGSVDYQWNKLFVTANYQTFKQTTSNGAQSLTVNNSDNQMYFGATYDFGILKAYAAYINRKVTATNAQYVSRTAQQIGVRGNLTKTIEGWASIGNGAWKSSSSGAVSDSPATANFTAYQLGSNYWLSKRTNLYAIFGSSQQSSASNGMYSEGANQYAVGVRHTF
jgi:predicted porin